MGFFTALKNKLPTIEIKFKKKEEKKPETVLEVKPEKRNFFTSFWGIALSILFFISFVITILTYAFDLELFSPANVGIVVGGVVFSFIVTLIWTAFIIAMFISLLAGFLALIGSLLSA